MELWIRSQNKDILMKVDNLVIDDEKNHIYTHNHINRMEMTYTLGKYKTKERALEVLDKIQNIICTNTSFDLYCKLGKFEDDFNNKYNVVPVFQMPKE